MIRAGANLVNQVQEIQQELDELKTAQFSSQSSGMKFYDVSPNEVVINVPASTSWSAGVKIWHKFTGNRHKNILVQRDIQIMIDGITLKIDEQSRGTTYMYSSGSTNFSVRPYVTKSKSAAYEDFQLSVINFSRSSSSKVRVKTKTKATDRGTDVITYEVKT